MHGDIRTSVSLSPVALRHLAPHLARMWRPHSSRQGVCGQHCFLRHRRSPPTSACHWRHPHPSLLTPQPARSLQAIPVLCSAPHLFPAARSIAVPQRAPGGRGVCLRGAVRAEIITVGIVPKPRNVLPVPIERFCFASGFKEQSGRQCLHAKTLEFWIFGFLWE